MSLPPPGSAGPGSSFPSGPGAPLTPPGWYPDPWGQGAQRWWDGMTWTHHLTATAAPTADPTKLVAATDATAVWLRRTLYVLPVTQLASVVFTVGSLHRAFQDLRDSIDSGVATPVSPMRGGGVAAGQLLSLVGIVALVLRMVWLYRATASARALGLTTRREPGLACAGWLIPIVSFWWPYQGTSDLLPPHLRSSAKVLRWWLTYVLGSIVVTFALLVAIFVSFAADSSSAPAWGIGLVALGVFALWAWFEVQLIDRVGTVHRELLGSRLGTDRPSYP